MRHKALAPAALLIIVSSAAAFAQSADSSRYLLPPKEVVEAFEQLVASAGAAIDKVVDMGVGDRDRIGVGGHSYGAFMTANLLAHSRRFRAGFAESGAYNRSLTPFGFQSERRTFPIQSERFYMALKGHGATVRYMTLPYEAHGYAARETLLHILAERINWFDKHVKNAPPRPKS